MRPIESRGSSFLRKIIFIFVFYAVTLKNVRPRLHGSETVLSRSRRLLTTFKTLSEGRLEVDKTSRS